MSNAKRSATRAAKRKPTKVKPIETAPGEKIPSDVPTIDATLLQRMQKKIKMQRKMIADRNEVITEKDIDLEIAREESDRLRKEIAKLREQIAEANGNGGEGK